MKKLIAVAIVAASLAGCGKSEYLFSDLEILPGPNGHEGNSRAIYVKKKGGDVVTGTVKKMVGDKVVLEFNVEDGKVVGDWKEFTLDGKPKVIGKVENQAWVGEWKSFCADENSETADLVRVTNGNRITSKNFDCATGLQTEEASVIADDTGRGRTKKVGVNRLWGIKDGKQIQLAYVSYAEDGSEQFDGVTEKYTEFGQLVERVNYKSGQPNGLSETWYAYTDGATQLKSRVNYVNGKKSGEYIEYRSRPWPEGIVEFKSTYRDGAQEGQKTSYSNGDAHTTESMKSNPLADKLVGMARGDNNSGANKVKDLDGFDYLIESSKIDINDKLGADGPLVVVAGENAYSLLVEKYGADVNAENINGKTRLDACFEFARTKCSYEHMALLANKQNLKHKDGYNRQPLANFCRNAKVITSEIGKEQSLKLVDLLIKGGDVNNTDLDNQTALHGCMQSRNPEIIEKLIAAGADLNVADYEGTTPAQMIFFSEYQLGGQKIADWNGDVIKLAAKYQDQSGFRLSQPLATFNRSIKDLMLEKGDTENARLVDSLEKKS